MSINRRNSHSYHRKTIQSNRSQQGHSLIELLIASAIAGMLVTASATGSIHLVRTNEQITVLQEIDGQLQFARSHAIASGKNTVMCGSANGTECDGLWGRGLLVTHEPSISEAAAHVTYVPLHMNHGTLLFRSFPSNRPMITLLPNGTLDRISNGSFWYCPRDNTNSEGKRVKLSRSGQTSRPEEESARTARRACN